MSAVRQHYAYATTGKPSQECDPKTKAAYTTEAPSTGEPRGKGSETRSYDDNKSSSSPSY